MKQGDSCDFFSILTPEVADALLQEAEIHDIKPDQEAYTLLQQYVTEPQNNRLRMYIDGSKLFKDQIIHILSKPSQKKNRTPILMGNMIDEFRTCMYNAECNSAENQLFHTLFASEVDITLNSRKSEFVDFLLTKIP